MWRNCGGRTTIKAFGLSTLVIAAVALVEFRESEAEAGFLKNGVRPGDRSSMTIMRRPGASVRKRIFAPGARPSASGRTRKNPDHAWFWKIHSTAASARSAARWAAALDTMVKRRAGGKQIADPARLARIRESYGAHIARAAAEHGISEALLMAVISVESNGAAKAVSPKGARGLMQLIPATAKRFGVRDSFDPAQNIDGGAAYLNWLLKEFGGDALLALAGYNAGEGAVRKHKGIPPYAETRDYVVKVLDAVAAARAICGIELTGPRKRCAFATPAG